MIEQVKIQIQVLRVKLDSDLFFLYERNNLISESDHTLSAKMYALTDEAKLEITNTNGNYEITKKSTIRLAEKFINQNFKNNLDNIIERGLFSTFLWIALTEFFIEQNDNEQILNCLCIANKIYGSTLAAKNEYYSVEIGKVLALVKSSEGGKTKAINRKNIEQPIREEAIEVYKNPKITNRIRWKSRNEFSQYFCMKHNKSIPNQKDWIKESTVKRWIKELLQSG
jgi:hypothetical protein